MIITAVTNPLVQRKVDTKKKYIGATVIVSITVHLGLILAIIYAAQFPSELPSNGPSIVEPMELPVLNSYLIVRRQKQETARKTKSDITQPLKGIAALEDTTSTNGAIEPVIEPAIEPVIEPVIEPRIAPKNQASILSEPSEQTPKANEAKLHVSPHQKTATSLALSAIAQLNDNAHSEMLNEETNTYNRLKNSPVIDTMGKLDTSTAALQYKPPVIRCEGALSETLVLLSSLSGGMTQCKQYEIQSFIDKRLNNETSDRQ